MKTTRMSNTKEKIIGFMLFLLTMIVTFTVYRAFDYKLEIPNYIDIVTSGIFFTAMVTVLVIIVF